MKKIYLLATALAALVSCTSDDFTGEPNLQEGNNGKSISFDLNTPAVTRAENKTGAGAAQDLNYQFIIWGEKNEINDGETGANVTIAPGTPGRDGDLVFENYIVRWTDNSAYTTTSNTKNWEYVGYKFDDSTVDPVTTNYSTNITPNTTGETAIVQTIKYWDYNASSYTFTAVSALPADISSGKVKITKHTSGTTVYDKGYEIAVNTGASLDKIFVADRNQPTVGTGTNREAKNTYGGNVTMSFRNFMSKIRFGIYETIPGYKVKVTRTYYNSTNSETNFGVDGKFLTAGDNTKFTVTYENSSNKALVNVKSGTTPNSQSYFVTEPADEVTSGTPKPGITVPILTADYIGTTSTTATFNRTETVTDPASVKTGAYTTILPFSTNDGNIKLKIDFQLISEDTGETIEITGKTAEVPAKYCQWKSNYAYTYLFKITDDDLYPITFDAVEVVDENGEAEYITTVSEPSITTFGVKGGKYSVGKSEYEAGTDIYATIVDGGNVVDFTLGTNVNVYLMTTSDADNFKITEASVAEALAETSTGTKKITYELKNSDATTSFTAAPDEVTTVPGEDGVDITDTHALKLTGAKATTATTAYAIEYIKTPATYNTEVVAIDSQDALEAYTGKLYTNATGTVEAGDTYDSGATYYKRTAVKSVGEYAYKVIRVQPAE